MATRHKCKDEVISEVLTIDGEVASALESLAKDLYDDQSKACVQDSLNMLVRRLRDAIEHTRQERVESEDIYCA